MARPVTTYNSVERGIQRITRTYADGRVVTSHRIRYADADGRIISRAVAGSLTKARAALAAARAEVQRGDHVVVTKSDSRITFKQVADHWHQHSTHMKASTREGHWRLINGSRMACLHDVTMRGLSYQRLQQFQGSLSDLAPATQKQIMWVVKAICSDAVKRGLLRANPAVDLPRIKAQQARVNMPSHEQVEALIRHLSRPTAARLDIRGRRLPEHEADPRWALLVETAAYAGLRAGELCGLQVRDLNRFNRSLTVTRSVPTKGRQVGAPKSAAGTRTVDDLDPALSKRLATLADGLRLTDFLFGYVDSDGVSQPYNHLNFYRRHFQPACRELGIDCRFHDLRHFHASLLIDAGLDPVKVAHRLGHSSASFTLNTYAHLFSQESTGLGERIAAKRAEARGEKRAKSRKPF